MQDCHGRSDDLARAERSDAQDDHLQGQEARGKYLDDDEARETLFEDGLVFRTDYPVDEKTIGDKLKKAQTIVDVMKRHKADEARAKGISGVAGAREPITTGRY